MAHVALIGAEIEENLSLRYIESSLKADGHKVSIIRFNSRHDMPRALELLIDSKAEIAGFSMVFTARAAEFVDLAKAVRKSGYTGHIIAGGHFAAFNAEIILNDTKAIDSVAVGEGESIMKNLAACAGDLSAVPGLIWRGHDGAIVKNISSVPPADLDSLPFPEHKNPPDMYHGLPVANILSSRGCNSSCSFCSISAWHRLCGGDRLRLRDPQKIADEMAQLYSKGYRIFNFHDDNFVLKDPAAMKERLVTLKNALNRHNIGLIAFSIKCRPDAVNHEVFRLMKDMGLFRVFVGIEAGTDTSLDKLGRGHTARDNIEALNILNGLDLNISFNLILLNPDSTLDDFKNNISFLRRFPSNPMNFCRAEIYSGTPLEQKLRSSGRLMGNYYGYDYLIADKNAQLAFELMNSIMYNRHHSPDNLHNATMILDYEYKLMAHFFLSNDALNRDVREFITRVNNDTCSRLETIISFAENRGESESAVGSFIETEKKALSSSDRKFLKESAAILKKVRRLRDDHSGMRYSRIAQIAASIGFAAAVSASSPACAGGSTHMCEMAPAYNYNFNGWHDDSTYYQISAAAPDASITKKIPRRISAKEKALLNAKIEVVNFVFGITLNKDNLYKYSFSLADENEILKIVLSGTLYKDIYDEEDNCELTYMITAPDLKRKVKEIQDRNNK